MEKGNLQKFAWVILIVMLFGANKLVAQFTLSGEFRPRAEFRHGYKSLVFEDDLAAFQISQRTRLNAAYQLDNIKFGLSIQDVRLWGETPQLVQTSNRIMLHQAWAEYGFSPKFSVKLGRQELVYDDARIFGNVDWTQQARTHDLALMRYEGDFKVHIGLAFNQKTDQLKTTVYDLAGNYKAMQFVWFNKKIGKLGVSALFLNNGLERAYTEDSVQKYETVYSQTIGARLTYAAKALSLYGGAYSTSGKDASDHKIVAYNANLGFNYDLKKGFGIGAGWETLSGTSQKEQAADPNYTNMSFNPFYGTNHKFNGFMDYFYVGNHANTVGLNDLYVNLSYKQKKMSCMLTAHFFSAANEVLKPGQTVEVMDNGFGTELDLTVGYKLNEIASFSAGYSQMFGTETLQ
ncbi:MAG: alginate export family protein, partial [Ignavibacteria bacterium]|nr:alginate export family protein [Ignavibacteria bacterium]